MTYVAKKTNMANVMSKTIVVVVERDLEPKFKGLHPSVFDLNCSEFAMFVTMAGFAKQTSYAQYVLEEAIVKLLRVQSHDCNFIHWEFEWFCDTKKHFVQYCSTSDKIFVARGVFRPRNFQFFPERLSGSLRFCDFYYIFGVQVVVSI